MFPCNTKPTILLLKKKLIYKVIVNYSINLMNKIDIMDKIYDDDIKKTRNINKFMKKHEEYISLEKYERDPNYDPYEILDGITHYDFDRLAKETYENHDDD